MGEQVWHWFRVDGGFDLRLWCARLLCRVLGHKPVRVWAPSRDVTRCERCWSVRCTGSASCLRCIDGDK